MTLDFNRITLHFTLRNKPLDYFLWDYLTSQIYKKNPQSTELKDEIIRVTMHNAYIKNLDKKVAIWGDARGGVLIAVAIKYKR